MNATERSMALGLRVLSRVAGSDVLDKIGVRAPSERVIYRASRDGFRVASTAGRSFARVQRRGKPTRPKPAGAGRFDLTPTDEQQMLVEAFRAFADEQLRPAAGAADKACAAPGELLGQAAELGLTMLGVPESLGGAIDERSSVTAVLAAEALGHGDMGLAAAALAPAGVATALSLWGDGDQQATYLPALLGEPAPADAAGNGNGSGPSGKAGASDAGADDGAPFAAALAVQEPRVLFDPFALQTTARTSAGDYVLSGVKSLVPLAGSAELLIVAAELDGRGPALFLVETKTKGVLVKDEPAMGVRGAATGEVLLDDVRVPTAALLGEASADVYAECVRRARLAWCALSVGAAQAVLDYVIPYVNERVAFGEPISNRQSVAFMVSNIAIELEGMRLATLRAASRADMGKDFAREAALARQLCSERGAQIGSDGVQLLGGHGYIKEHPVERWYRDLRAVGLIEGGLLV